MNEFRTQEVPYFEHESNSSVLRFDKEDSGEPIRDSDSRGSDTVGAVYALTKKIVSGFGVLVLVVVGTGFSMMVRGAIDWAVESHPLYSLAGFGGLIAVVVVACAVTERVERRAFRQTVQRLLSLDAVPSRRDWSLAAPESYVLLRGVKKARSDGFKLGLLQVMAAEVFVPKDHEDTETGAAQETSLTRGPTSMEAVTGSLQTIYDLCDDSSDVTISEIGRQAHEKYGSLDQFVDQVVVPELVRAGLYGEGRLLPAGEAAQADLETRLADVLREMQVRRGSWVEQEPRHALLGALLAVALGQRKLSDETDLQLVSHQVDQGGTMAVASQGTDGYYSDMGVHWLMYYDFDRYFGMVDCGVDACGGDGGDGGDGGGGGE